MNKIIHESIAPAGRRTTSAAWKHSASALLLISCVMLAAGCAVGPDFHSPGMNAPARWSGLTLNGETAGGAPVARAATISNWWDSFNDATLNSLVRRAVAANPDLKRAESRIRQARAELGVVTSGLWPSAAASASDIRSESSKSAGAAGLYKAGLDASWELDIFGGTRRAVEAARADIAAAVEDRNDVMVTLLAEVALAYINLRGYQRQIAISEENLRAQEQSVGLVRKLLDGGFNSRLDMVNAEAQVETIKAQLPTLEARARQAIFSLSVLLATEPAALLAELSETAAIPVAAPEVTVGLPSELLRRRPDIRRAEAQLHAATARIGVATADLFPKFSLTGSIGITGKSSLSLVEWDNRSYSVGPTVSWAIFNAGKICFSIRVQNELEEQALLGYQKTVLAAFGDVEQALVAYVNEQQRRMALSKAAQANQDAVALASRLYREGQTDFLNVLSAQRALCSVQLSLAQSEGNVATSLVSLYKALGGGWTGTIR